MSEEKRPCIALAGNPNTGKSTLFNALTGLKQHTGNWSGKTVGRAEGRFLLGEQEAVLVDLPGIYSLFSAGAEEACARDFLEMCIRDRVNSFAVGMGISVSLSTASPKELEVVLFISVESLTSVSR